MISTSSSSPTAFGHVVLFSQGPELDPLSSVTRPAPVGDARLGALIGHRLRRALRTAERDARRRSLAEIDLGEPSTPRGVIGLLALILAFTLVELQRFGLRPTVLELDRAGGLSAAALARGEWAAALTSNLLHSGLEHLGLNVFVIVLMGRWLEWLVGTRMLVAVVAVSALGASLGALLAAPLSVTIGASGIAFGMLGCAITIDPRARTAVGSLGRTFGILNIIATFVVPGISIGGHLGGLAGGVLVGLVAWDRRRDDAHPIGQPRAGLVNALVIVSVLVVAWLASWHVIAPDAAREAGQRIAHRLIA